MVEAYNKELEEALLFEATWVLPEAYQTADTKMNMVQQFQRNQNEVGVTTRVYAVALVAENPELPTIGYDVDWHEWRLLDELRATVH